MPRDCLLLKLGSAVILLSAHTRTTFDTNVRKEMKVVKKQLSDFIRM